MTTYTVHEAKTHLSKLIERAERGEEVIIARGDKPVVRMTSVEKPERKKGRRPGAYKDELPEFPDSFFFDPLPEDELRLWNCEGDDVSEHEK
jgi:prevent-host-death family protein